MSPYSCCGWRTFFDGLEQLGSSWNYLCQLCSVTHSQAKIQLSNLAFSLIIQAAKVNFMPSTISNATSTITDPSSSNMSGGRCQFRSVSYFLIIFWCCKTSISHIDFFAVLMTGKLLLSLVRVLSAAAMLKTLIVPCRHNVSCADRRSLVNSRILAVTEVDLQMPKWLIIIWPFRWR